MIFGLLLLAGASVHWDFEGGSLKSAEQPAPNRFRCAVAGESDQDHRNRQANWYYFRIDGAAPGRELVIDLVNLPGEYNYRPNRGAVTKDTIPVYSYDRKTWTHFERREYDAAEPRLRLILTPRQSTVWIAHVPPYTNADLVRLLEDVRKNPALRISIAGKTAGGRDIPLLTITDPAASGPKRSIWLLGRQHAWETGSSWAVEGAIRYLLSPEAADVRRGAVFHILPMCDPDGVARGGVRFNVNGYDLNRNWDTIDPKLMPEIAAERAAILASKVDLLLTLHNTETSEYLDGPPGDEYRPLLERWFAILKDTTTFAPTRPPQSQAVSTTPGKPGRMDVVQGLYHDRRIPAFVMEQRISFNPRLGHLPRIEDRKAFGAQLARSMYTALQ